MNTILEAIEFNRELPYQLVFSMIGVYFVIFWVGCIVYVWNDSKYYTSSSVIRIFCIFLTSIFGVFGVFLYVFFRENTESNIGVRRRCCAETMWFEGEFCTVCGEKLFKICIVAGCENSVAIGDLYCSLCGASQKVAAMSLGYDKRRGLLEKIGDIRISPICIQKIKRSKFFRHSDITEVVKLAESQINSQKCKKKKPKERRKR